MCNEKINAIIAELKDGDEDVVEICDYTAGQSSGIQMAIEICKKHLEKSEWVH